MLKTNFNETQYRRIVKMALEKGITIGKQGQGKGVLGFGAKTDGQIAELHLTDFINDINALFPSE